MILIKKRNKIQIKNAFIKSAFVFAFYLFINLSLNYNYFLKNPFYNDLYKKFKEDNFFRTENKNCDKFDPIFLMGERFKKSPINICKNNESIHICYLNSKFSYYNQMAKSKYGVICQSKNFILNPLKSNQTNYIYKGPVDKIYRGAPILSKGFFNMNCEVYRNFRSYFKIYKSYFKSWKYYYKKEKQKIQELAPGKTILFISRNQDSPNVFHGLSELINTISIMYIFNLKPENVQVIFLESMKLLYDPFYELYKRLVSRGGKPLFIRNLKQKYHISSAIHIPINWDSPLFIRLPISRGYPDCKYSTQTYNIFNNLINKYIKISNFKDSFVSDQNIFYYPESVIKNYKLKINFTKSITIQWRKVWPSGRKNQKRILGNGPELADRLSSVLPNNYLIRLVDTASLSFISQISIMRKTDLLIGIHGAGLALSIFMPNKSILYEILPKENNKDPIVMSSLSGHKTYSDILKSESKIVNDNEYIFFNISEFIDKTMGHLRENNF
jgi:hypothetical protein